MADPQIQEELKTLKEDLAQLRSDLSELTQAVRDEGAHQAERAQSSLQDEIHQAREELRRKISKAREHGQHTVHDLEGRIGERPFSTMAIAFGFGFVIAKLLELGGRR